MIFSQPRPPQTHMSPNHIECSSMHSYPFSHMYTQHMGTEKIGDATIGTSGVILLSGNDVEYLK